MEDFTIAINLVTGVTGVGKSSALLSSGLSNVVNLGTLLFETAYEEGLVARRDDLRLLAPEARQRLRNAALSTVRDGAILDVHLSVLTPYGLESAVPETLIGRIHRLAILEAPASTIFDRRKNRIDRVNAVQDLKELEEQQAFNRQVAEWLRPKAVCILDATRPVEDVAAELRRFLG